MSGSVTEQLVRAGFGDADARSRTALVEQATQHHLRVVRQAAARAWFVPGRIEVFGKHTDYAGGRSLVAAVPRGFAIVASPRRDGIVTVHDARWQSEMAVDPRRDEPSFRGWANYVAVVARRFARNFPGADLGVDLTIASDLPTASGLSSSSALVVGVSSALVDCASLDRRPEWRTAIQSLLDLAGYLGAVENGLTFPSLPGSAGVGTHGGSEDHTAILTGRADTISAFRYVPVRALEVVMLPPDWRFTVLTSGVHADKAGAVREKYNRASLLTRALVEAWSVATGRPGGSLADVLAIEGAEPELRRLVRAGSGGYGGEDLERRLTHFIAEDERVLPAVHACRTADAGAIGALADASQHDARELLGNQVEETIRLAALAREAGAFAASSFGAGFGGSVWALVRAGEADQFAAAWRTAYQREFPAARPVDGFTCRPSPGATRLELSG